MARGSLLGLLAGLGLANGCGSEEPEPDAVVGAPGFVFGPVSVEPDGAPPAELSTYQLVHANPDGSLLYNQGVFRYTLNTALFSDYALKDRAIYLPAGETLRYVEDDVFEFPVGSVIVKTFSFPADFRAPTVDVRVIETRVLVRGTDGWQAYPYVWRDDLSDADYAPAGQVSEISFIGADGEARSASYLVPQRNQCRSCHAIDDGSGTQQMTLIGPEAQHLNGPLDGDPNGASQLEVWRDAGRLTGLPSDVSSVDRVEPFTDADAQRLTAMSADEINAAARGYLDVNCAHCHNDRGVSGVSSQLFLDTRTTDPFNLGVCKRPGSAGKGSGGRQFDIVPGDADASILIFRVETTELGAIMPGLGRSLPHAEGIELLKAWINQMPAQDCE